MEQTPAPHNLPEQALKQLPWATIGREVFELHQAYTRKRGQTAGGQQAAFGKQENPLHERLLGGQFYFLPRNIQRVRLVLRSLPWQTSLRQTPFGKIAPPKWLLEAWLQPNPANDNETNPSKETPHTPPSQTLEQAGTGGRAKVPSLPAAPSAKAPSLPAEVSAKVPSLPAAPSAKVPSLPAEVSAKAPSLPAEVSAKAPSLPAEVSAKAPSLPAEVSAKVPIQPAAPSAKAPIPAPAAPSAKAPIQPAEVLATAPSLPAEVLAKVPTQPAEVSATAPSLPAAPSAKAPSLPAAPSAKVPSQPAEVAEVSAKVPRPKPSQILRVLDLGCGTGAFSLAVLDFLRELGPPPQGWPQVDITLVDQSRRSLGQARRNLRAYAALALPDLHLTMRSYAHGAQTFLDDHTQHSQYALAGAAMVMNELAVLGPRRTSKKAARLAASMQQMVMPTGIWLVVEAGVRKGYMQMMALREQWLKQGVVLYPCTHQNPCPLWSPTVRQWCHTSQYLPKDFFFDALLRERAGVDFRMDDLNASGLVVQFGSPVSSPPAPPAPPTRESQATSQWVSQRLGLASPTPQAQQPLSQAQTSSQWVSQRLGLASPTPQAQQPLSQAQAPFRVPYGARILSHTMLASKAVALIGSHARLQHTPPKYAKPLNALLSCEENGQLGLREATSKVAVFRGQLVKPYALELPRIPLRMLPVFQPKRKGNWPSPTLPKKTVARAKKTTP